LFPGLWWGFVVGAAPAGEVPRLGCDAAPLASAYGVVDPAREATDFLALDASASYARRSNDSAEKKWRFDFMLYGLFASLNGSVTVKGHSADEDIGAQQIVSNLQFTMAGRTRLSYERWFTAFDIFYVGLAGAAQHPPADLTFHQWIGQGIAGYGVCDRFDVFAGARYNQMNVEVDFQGPLGKQRSGVQDWWDPIVGGIFKDRFVEHFGYAIYADVGGFGLGSRITTKFEPMISWYMGQHASLDLSYQLYYADYHNSSDGFVYDSLMYGPLVGFSLHF
jgi:hypothetical protein